MQKKKPGLSGQKNAASEFAVTEQKSVVTYG